MPPDNPFVSTPGGAAGDLGVRRAESVAVQLRRSGARRHRRAVIGDVGQNTYEEIDYEPAGSGGRNYGWRNREGAHDHSPRSAGVPAAGRSDLRVRPHGRASITGGYVYRGPASPGARGRYFFGDFVKGRVWSINLVVDPTTHEATAAVRLSTRSELGGTGVLGNISGFGLDAAGELYIISYSRGAILRVAKMPGAPGNLRIKF